jgi:hypothetical protein
MEKEPGYEVLNKKYVRDLDDIKEEYSRWISRQKKNPLQPVKKKFLIRWAILILLIIAGFIAERWDGADAADNINLKADSVEVESSNQKPVITKPGKNKKSAAQETPKNKKASITPSEKKSKDKEREKSDKQANEADAHVAEKKVDANLIFRQLDIRYSYDTSNHEGMKGLHFTIHNGSDNMLNAVAVNVYYKNGEGELLQKETIYFNNLLPGKSATTAASPAEKATVVTYKTGLISINGDIYYTKED